MWSVRGKESGETTEGKVALRAIERLEIVLPRQKFKMNARDYSIAEVFVVDVHGHRSQLPVELWPGVHHSRISTVLKTEIPNLQVVERLAAL